MISARPERPLRILLITPDGGWPTLSGLRHRMAHTAQALALLGEVDWFVASRGEPDFDPPPPKAGVRRFAGASMRLRPRRETMVRFLTSRRSWVYCAYDADDARRTFRQFAHGSYDLVWFARLDAVHFAESLVHAHASVADLDEIEGRAVSPEPEPLLERVMHRLDAKRRLRELRSATAASSAAVFCSAIDAELLDHPKAEVIFHGTSVPPRESLGVLPAEPRLLFVGDLRYEPNADALRWFLHDIWPAVRAATPVAHLDVAGRTHPHQFSMGHDPSTGVTIHGPVDDLEDYYRSARVVVAPIRFGSGVRLKLLEAFARGRPVVTTTVGAEGIPARHGEHAFIADDPAATATGITTLLRDDAAAQQLADAARDLSEGYDWSIFDERVAALVGRVTGRARR